MYISDEKAARIQELLRKLETSDVYEGAGIATEIRKVAEDHSSYGEAAKRSELTLQVVGAEA